MSRWPILVQIILLGIVAPAGAASISGTVVDTQSGLPLAGVDIDLLDEQFRVVPTPADLTGPDGTYLLSNLDKGNYFLRADPNLPQNHVDEYYPGVVRPALATPLILDDTTALTGIDFSLEVGGTISGTIRDAGNLSPLANIDLDLYDADLSLLVSVDAVSALDGTFTLGALAQGSYLLRADPDGEAGQLHVDEFHADAPGITTANWIQVVGTGDTGGIDFDLTLGGTIQGTVTDSFTGQPIVDLDIDVFDAAGVEILWADAVTDDAGVFVLGALPPGVYFLLADPTPDQPYDNTFFGNVATLAESPALGVSAGVTLTGFDFQLAPLAYVRGRIVAEGSGVPLPDIDLDAVDAIQLSLFDADGLSDMNGDYALGPLPPGQYFVRADATLAQGYVDEYHPGVLLRSQATIVTVNGSDVTGVDFVLAPGQTISGHVVDAQSSAPAPGIDMDVLTPTLETISSVDATTDALGNFVLGALPPGDYLVRADPSIEQGYRRQYYALSDDAAGAVSVTVVAVGGTAGIDFQLLPPAPVAVSPLSSDSSIRLEFSPNPFAGQGVISLRGALPTDARLEIYDVRGRRVQAVSLGAGASDERVLTWNARDTHGAALANGTYFLRLQWPGAEETRKITLIR